MDIHTLSTSMINQATAAVTTQNTLPVQPVHADTANKPNGSDSVSISTEARVKAASIPAAASSSSSSAAQGTDDTLARRITKLQKELQREQGSSESAEEKAGQLTALRGQIRHLQNQQKGNVADAATTFKIKNVVT